jgi:tripartite-type tricarboxylate transporter receptor subunit TctC
VRIIVPAAAGGSADVLARLIGRWLSERLGQRFLIGTTIGTEAVVNAPPDGYTLLLISASNAVNTTLYQNLKFIFHRDIVPVASIWQVPQTLDVNPSVPTKTVP